MVLIYFADAQLWPKYQPHLAPALAAVGVQAQIITDAPENPALVDYIIYAPTAPLQDFTPFTRCKAVLSLWAGVERIVGNTSLTQPLCRMVDTGLTEGMVEWVCGHVLRYHLGMDAHIINPARAWNAQPAPLARSRTVAMLGMGTLGQACAKALTGLGFGVLGWSRSGASAAYSGQDGLAYVLGRADFIVTLLPKTAETENLIGREALTWAKRGAVLLNPGRGALIDDDALLEALNTGQIAHATLDVFRTEPLPQDHPFWAHPRITVTPHIAAETRPEGAVRALAENIRRSQNGDALLYQVDRARGY